MISFRIYRFFRVGNRSTLIKCCSGVASADRKPNEKPIDDVAPKSEIDPISGSPFRRFELIPVQNIDDVSENFVPRFSPRVTPPPRAERMPTDQDWPSVWPTAHSFKASAVPLPIRMGYQTRLKKPPPAKTGNLELMKIPNFLHLTPPAIKRQCDAIKKFCTQWPSQLDDRDDAIRREYLPIEITTHDYVHAGPSIRDPRSRVVTLEVKLGDLPLGDDASRQRKKFLKLAAERYDKNTDMLTIVTDRCPARHQNRDYAMYLLAVLYHEAWKLEPWESEIAAESPPNFFNVHEETPENIHVYGDDVRARCGLPPRLKD